MTAADVKARLAKANATIAVARRALDEGKIVSLDGLKTHVDATCRAVIALPGEEGRALRPAMMALCDELTRLAEGLGREYGDMKSALGELTDRKRAQSAYLKP